jgi:hypothetical protein
MADLIVGGTVTGIVRCLLCDGDAVLRIENGRGATADFCEPHADLKPLLDAYKAQTNGTSIVVLRVEPNATVAAFGSTTEEET